LAVGLVSVDHEHAGRSVIHGDLTNHNVVVAGSPVGPVAAIDFANAYVEATLADVAFALWRSGRPFQAADTFEVRRVADYVAGYHERRPLSERDATAIVVYLRARGIQIMVKQARRHPERPIDNGPLKKLTELSRIEPRLLDAITAAVTRGT
jgi:Ser/Thr protein kinase RdoA (MazF antagonist)